MRRRTPVVLLLACAVALAGLGAPVWATATAEGIAGAVHPLELTGHSLAPELVPLALVLGAAAAATALVRRGLRVLVGPAALLAGAAVVAVAAVVLADPSDRVGGLAADATGLRGGAVADLSLVPVWPVLVALVGVLALATGVLLTVRGVAVAAGRRFDRDASVPARRDGDDEAEDDPAALWDSLSRGDDPST